MPLISNFYGVLIYIYDEANTRHHIPHFHAIYNEFEMVVSCDGEIIEGGKNFPVKQRKLVEAWALLHTDETKAAWTAWTKDGEKIKIVGLS